MPLITFEGLDGAGKSTQIALLAERLRAAGQPFVVVREPGGTPLGEEIRALVKGERGPGDATPEAQLMLFNAARAQLVSQVIRPALARGEIVLCDRFADSSVAYQGYGGGLVPHEVERACNLATGGLQPDLTLLLRLTPEQRRQRIHGRGQAEDVIERQGERFFERVAFGFDRIAHFHARRVAVIDASEPVGQVAAAVSAAVAARLSLRGVLR